MMGTNTPKPIRLLVELGRPVILSRWRSDSCVASTAIGMKVLRRFGIESYPLPVQMGAYNEVFLEMLEGLGNLQEEPAPDVQQYWLERGAWSIEVDEDASDGIGHLVLSTKRHLIDLSLDQASRPHKGIVLEPHACEVPNSFHEGEAFGTTINRTLVIYRKNPTRRAFLESPDWTDDSRHESTVDEIVRMITKQIERRKPR